MLLTFGLLFFPGLTVSFGTDSFFEWTGSNTLVMKLLNGRVINCSSVSSNSTNRWNDIPKFSPIFWSVSLSMTRNSYEQVQERLLTSLFCVRNYKSWIVPRNIAKTGNFQSVAERLNISSSSNDSSTSASLKDDWLSIKRDWLLSTFIGSMLNSVLSKQKSSEVSDKIVGRISWRSHRLMSLVKMLP